VDIVNQLDFSTLFNRDASLLCDAARLHDDIIVDGFGAARPPLNFFDRPSQSDCKFLIASFEPTITESFKYCSPLGFIRTAIIDWLVR
jgi:hypothetical protein